MNATNNLSSLEMMLVERMCQERMKGIQGEADTIRWLHHAGLTKPGLFGRAAVAFGSTLVKLGQRLQLKYDHSHQACQTTSNKYAV